MKIMATVAYVYTKTDMFTSIWENKTFSRRYPRCSTAFHYYAALSHISPLSIMQLLDIYTALCHICDFDYFVILWGSYYTDRLVCIKQQSAELQRNSGGGWFYSCPLTTRYQQRNLTLLTLLCQNTHSLTGRRNLAEKWYCAVYGNRARKKRAYHHARALSCVRHSNGP